MRDFSLTPGERGYELLLEHCAALTQDGSGRAPAFGRLEEVLGIFVDGDENHARSLALLFDGTTRGQAILLGHAHVNQGEIGLQATAERQRLAPIDCLAYHLQSALTNEHGTQASPGKFMVISNHQTRWFGLSRE